MSLKIDQPVSDGVASITATNEQVFTFSNGYGNALIIACEAGGLMRVSVDGTDTDVALTAETAGTSLVYCDGGNVVLQFPLLRDADMPTVVRITPYSNVTNLGVTLGIVG